MSKLDKKRTELELIKVSTARAEIEFRIEEALEQVDKYKEMIQIQLKKEDDLKQKIQEMN